MRKTILTILLPILILVMGNAQAQTIINSLAELNDRLDDSNGDFKMTPGTYYFNTDNCGPGKLFPNSNILLFTGSNSTFDFTDVKFEFDTEIFAVYTAWAVNFWPTGNNNVYLNLTMENIGMKTPNAGGEAIHLDGNDNRIEGFHITVRSSYPYGYGDIFGKGSGSVIGPKKRAGILVRGDRNHVKNCTVMMESYGHGIFMQGAKDALIEGCHVEGKLRTIQEVLQEQGSGSPADNVNFMSVWGYDLRNLQHNYRFSLQEDGIRAYTTGVIYGTTEERSTTGTQVVNCTVVKMRSGVTIGWDYTAKRVENCKVLACETGYWFGSLATATGCSGDASVGPLVSEDVGRSNSNIQITLLDNYVPKIGNTPYFFFAGSGHNLTLHDGTTSFNSDIELQVGGERVGHRWLAGSGEEPLDRTATNCTFTNNTKYPVVLASNASNNSINSCGPVTNNGSSNTITTLTNCSYTRPCVNTAENLQAECYDDMLGIGTQNIAGTNNEREVYGINTGDWISFNNIDLAGMVSVEVLASGLIDGITIEVRQGSVTGTLLSTIPVSSTTSNSMYQKFLANLNQTVSGSANVYFVFKHATETGWLCNLDKISFIQDTCFNAYYNAYSPISAEAFCDASGIQTETISGFNQAVSGINDGDYVRYSNVDFGIETYNSIKFSASSATTGGTIEVRSGSVSGSLLAKVTVGSTGVWSQYQTFSVSTSNKLTGVHDIYLVFTGVSGDLFNLDWFEFHEDFSDADNLALATNGGLASQSTTDYEGDASRANDGNTDGNFGSNSVSHTEHGTDGSNTLKWWQVDLGANKIIREIVIYNRTGSTFGTALNNFTVQVINSLGVVTFTQFVSAYPNPSIKIDANGAVGKIVKISKTSDKGIQLAEVKVFGTSALLSVNDFKLGQIKVFPNPATNQVTIKNGLGLTLEIYNILGALESKIIISENEKVINIEQLNSGIYLLKLSSAQGSTIKKLIKK